MLKSIAHNDEKRRNQVQTQEFCHKLDEALCNFLPLPVVAKSSILNAAEFPDPSLKMSPCTKTSPVLCENQSFFLLFQNVVTFIKSLLLLPYNEILSSSILDSC